MATLPNEVEIKSSPVVVVRLRKETRFIKAIMSS